MCLKIAIGIEILMIFTISIEFLEKIYGGEYIQYSISSGHWDQTTGPIDLKFGYDMHCFPNLR